MYLFLELIYAAHTSQPYASTAASYPTYSFFSITIRDIVTAPIRHRVELYAVRELHLSLIEQPLEFVSPSPCVCRFSSRSLSSVLRRRANDSAGLEVVQARSLRPRAAGGREHLPGRRVQGRGLPKGAAEHKSRLTMG